VVRLATLGATTALGLLIAVVAQALPDQSAGAADTAAQVAALKAKVAALEPRVGAPELGHQMLELQIRHDRLWWAGDAGNWNLAYYMVSELGEALRDIAATNADAPELQPERLADVMPAIMTPAIAAVQAALARHDRAAFATAYDGLSAACNACHQTAGVGFIHLQRPRTPLLDNLRYAPPPASR
jgi:hypothetical protein